MKKVDIGEIVKRSLHEAKKSHGLIREEEEETTAAEKMGLGKEEYPPFDPEKHMPNFEIAGLSWGKADEAEHSVNELNAYIESIRAGSQDFKDFLKNFNTALGMNIGSEGDPLPLDIEADNFNLSRVVSALTLRKLMVSIVRKNKGGAAGDIWEGLYARLLGGKTTDADNPIEDISFDPKHGALLSLKLLTETDAKIKGSKLELAMALAKHNGGAGKRTKIPLKYIVGIKQGKEGDIFKVKFFSFEITKENYFQWIFGNPDPAPKEIKDFIDQVLITITNKGKGAAGKTSTAGDSGNDLDFQDFLKIATTPEKEEAFQQINIALRTIENDPVLLTLVKEKTGMESLTKEDFYSSFLFKGYFTSTPGKPSKGGKAAKPELNKLINLILTSFSRISLADYISASGGNPADPAQQTQFREKQRKDMEALKSLILSLELLNKEYQKEQKLHRDAMAAQSTQKHAAVVSSTNINQAIDDFWNNLSNLVSRNFQLEGDASQFKFRVTTILSGFNFISADYGYQPIIIDTKAMFISSQKMVASFKKYAEPIYRDRYYMDIALRKYFVDDKPQGMIDFEKTLKQSEQDISILLNTSKDSDEKYTQASKLGKSEQPIQENKKVFTRNYIDDILDDL
jgi:hypothetical protein